MEGQILRNTPFGNALFKVASDPQYNIFLDVGTWNGMGTTKILVDATKNNPTAQIYSVEANKTFYDIARGNWRPCPDRLHLLYGRVGDKILSARDALSHPMANKIKPHFDLYYKQDVEDFNAAPLISIPTRYADVVVLDGGEWCGEGDLKAAMALRPKVIALDDVHVVKNYYSLLQLINSGEWVFLARGAEKTGWAIMQRASSAATDFLSRYIEPGFGC
jgi:hypothetical protein